MKEGKVGTYRHLRLPTDYDKCLSNDYHLNMGQTRDISGLQWFDSRHISELKTSFNPFNIEINKTRVEIYYSGIIFKDIMLASGINLKQL